MIRRHDLEAENLAGGEGGAGDKINHKSTIISSTPQQLVVILTKI